MVTSPVRGRRAKERPRPRPIGFFLGVELTPVGRWEARPGKLPEGNLWEGVDKDRHSRGVELALRVGGVRSGVVLLLGEWEEGGVASGCGFSTGVAGKWVRGGCTAEGVRVGRCKL